MFFFDSYGLYPAEVGGGGGGSGPAPAVNLSNASVSYATGFPVNQIAGVRINSNGTVQLRRGSSYTTHETWLLTGAASDYEAYATATLGASTGTFGSALNLGTSREWYGQPAGDYIITVQIRLASDHSVLDTATYSITVEDLDE